jgi:hypothetical protein
LASLPVGRAAIMLIALGAAAAAVLGFTGLVNRDAAAFAAAVVLVGTLLGIATWDLFVVLVTSRRLRPLALPERFTLGLSRRAVPYLSPAAFALGLLAGHQFWH